MIAIAIGIFVLLVILVFVYFDLRAKKIKNKEYKQVELAKRGKESLDELEKEELDELAKESLDKLGRRLAKKQLKAELKEEMKPKAVGARFLRWMLVGIAAAILFGLIGLLMSSC